MKKGKVIMTVTIGISCFILIMIIFMQFRVVHETEITSIDTMRESELRSELANWKSKCDEVELKYQEVEEKLKSYKEESTTDSKTREKLEEELEELNLVLGKTDVEGEGIIITLKDGNDYEAKVEAEKLLLIVNTLKEAGAEAISINEQRIINSSYIVLISNSFIKVNSQRIVAPYVIKAIGKASYLEGALFGTGGYAEELKALGMEVNVVSEDEIEIPKYNGEMNVKYIKEVE